MLGFRSDSNVGSVHSLNRQNFGLSKAKTQAPFGKSNASNGSKLSGMRMMSNIGRRASVASKMSKTGSMYSYNSNMTSGNFGDGDKA